MAKVNKKTGHAGPVTHEGAPAKRITSEQELRRAVMACLLWEDTFYESGLSIADRIKELVEVCPTKMVEELAVEARTRMNLRHVPLLLCRELARKSRLKARILTEVIRRPDELAEFVAIFWKEGRKTTLTAQAKKGLAGAFGKFNEYSLAKYNRDEPVKLRDVLFLCHAKPEGEEQAALWKRLIDGELAIPDTWETELSAGKDKKETWERLIKEKKLGALALLRNLRNMESVKVNRSLVKAALAVADVSKVLPFRFISAARFAPPFEPELEGAMMRAVKSGTTLKGNTVVLVDVSGSMDTTVSGKSQVSRIDAACGVAMILREVCAEVTVATFSNHTKEVPARRGFALRDAINTSQSHQGTNLGDAVDWAKKQGYDRLVVISDEQSHQQVEGPLAGKTAYMINVASYQNGVGYGNRWTHIDGFSEAVVRYIQEVEAEAV